MSISAKPDLESLLHLVRACDLCREDLPLGPRPIIRANNTATILIIGQAPGTKVHQSGIPWDDPSGDRLRDWMQIDKPQFYDTTHIAIMPMGFCYPGRLPKGGDAPPRPECAPHWHPRIKPLLPNIKLTLLVGRYAQAYYLDTPRTYTMTDTVKNFHTYLKQDFLPLPHPSWRTRQWQKKNPWFAENVLPELRKRLRALNII